MTPEDCLPPDLRGPGTTILPITAGLSGAGVYRVESAGRSFVLKVAADGEGPSDWRRALHVQRLAADAGLAPRVVHVDEGRRAVVTDFVADRSFVSFYRDPRTHEAALALLGRTVRRIHSLPVPPDVSGRDPREFLAGIWEVLRTGFALPGFVGDSVRRALAEEPPPGARAVLGHNDLNPGNLVYDGEAIVLLDWAAAGPADASYDLATLAVFLRMDEGDCRHLLAGYDGADVGVPPARFLYSRRLVAALAGTMQLYVARQMNHGGATGAETLDDALPLGEFYQRMGAGLLKLGTADGQWAFGLALLKESLAL